MVLKRTMLDLALLATAAARGGAAATDGTRTPAAQLPSMRTGARTTEIVGADNQGGSSTTTQLSGKRQ